MLEKISCPHAVVKTAVAIVVAADNCVSRIPTTLQAVELPRDYRLQIDAFGFALVWGG